MVKLSKETTKEMAGGRCGKGGAIMAECLKKTDGLGKEGLLRDGVHRNELIAEIVAVLNKAEEQQLQIILRFAKRIIE